MMKNAELAQIVRAAQSGDKEAVEMLYKLYRDRIWFFVCKNIDSKQTAEDIVSDIFLTAIEKLSDLRCANAFGSWLYSIAYRKCVQNLNAESTAAHFDSNEELESTIQSHSLNSPVALPQDYIESEQTRQQLRNAINSLKPEMRSAVIMYYFEEMSVAEVGDALGISENAAKQKLFQARKKLLAKLKMLSKNGSSLCVVPIGAVMNAIFESGSATVGVSSAAVTASLSVKLAIAFISGALVVGIPVALHNRSSQGDYRPEQASQQDYGELRSEVTELLTSLKGMRFEYSTKSMPKYSGSVIRPQIVQQGKSDDIGLPQMFLNNSDKWKITMCSSIDERGEESVTLHYSAPLSDLVLYYSDDGNCRLFIHKYPYSYEDAGKFICIELDANEQDRTVYNLMHPDIENVSDYKNNTRYDLAPMSDSTGLLSYNIMCTARGEIDIELLPKSELLEHMQDVTFSASSYTEDKAQNTHCSLSSNGSKHYFETGDNITHQLPNTQHSAWKIRVSDIPNNCEKLQIRLNYKTKSDISDTAGGFTTELNIDMTQLNNKKE